MKLQKVSGLSEVDPIWHDLGQVDQILGNFDWNELTVEGDELLNLWIDLFKGPNHLEEQFMEMHKLLQNTEPVLANLIVKLREKWLQQELNSIQALMLYLFVNVETFKEQSLGESQYRSIYAGWRP